MRQQPNACRYDCHRSNKADTSECKFEDCDDHLLLHGGRWAATRALASGICGGFSSLRTRLTIFFGGGPVAAVCVISASANFLLVPRGGHVARRAKTAFSVGAELAYLAGASSFDRVVSTRASNSSTPWSESSLANRMSPRMRLSCGNNCSAGMTRILSIMSF